MHSETIIRWNIWWVICKVKYQSLLLPSRFRNQHWFIIYSTYKLTPEIIYIPDRDCIHMDYLYILNFCLKEKLFSAFTGPSLPFNAPLNSSSSMKLSSLQLRVITSYWRGTAFVLHCSPVQWHCIFPGSALFLPHSWGVVISDRQPLL